MVTQDETTGIVESDGSEAKADAIMREAEERLQQCVSHYSDEYDRVAEELRFIGGDQWNKDIRKGRGRNQREVTQNILKPYRDRLVNPLRLHPLGGNVTGSAPIIEPLRAKIRKIEQSSRADEVANDGFEDAVSCGYGYMEIELKMKKRLEICYVRPSQDPTTVMLDPGHQLCDGGDATFAFKSGYIGEDKAKKEFGDKDYSGYWSGLSMTSTVGSAQMLTYYRIEDGKAEIYRFVGKQLVYEAVLPIPYLPIWLVGGDRYRRSDDLYFRHGIVKQARDSQILVNFYKSQEATRIARAPKSQWLLERGQLGQNAEQWDDPNAYSKLVYDQVATIGVDSRPLPPPQRLDNTANTGDLQAPYQAATSDVGRVLGMPDSMFGVDTSLGGESGKAVLARQAFSEISTANFMDNVKKSIEHGTRIVIALIPHVYTTPENVNVSDAEGTEQTITVDWNDPSIDWDEVNVDVASGPAYASKRKEDTDVLIEAVKMNPQAAPVLMDIVLRQQDSPGAKEMAKRLKKMLPPELQDVQQGAEPPDPQALQALQAAQQTVSAQEQEITAMREMIGQLQAALVANEQKNETAMAMKQIDAQTQMAISREGNLVKLDIARMNREAKTSDLQTSERADTARKIMELENDAKERQQDMLVEFAKSQQEATEDIGEAFQQYPGDSLRGSAPGGLLNA